MDLKPLVFGVIGGVIGSFVCFSTVTPVSGVCKPIAGAITPTTLIGAVLGFYLGSGK